MSDRTRLMELSLDRIEDARAVLIAGPTASGKSALALELAYTGLRAGAKSSSSTPIPCRFTMHSGS
jgi:KaiC/GvpD/RAD55 family RecA-like ATPase